MSEAPLYDRIGAGYDRTRRADPYIASRIVQLLELRRDGVYLDLACGTGNYTVALAGRGGRWTGVDPAMTMIEQGRRKSDAILWRIGSAEDIPAADGSSDGVVCLLALHHFRDLTDALRETRRVIRGGSLVVFTSTPEQMRAYWLNTYFPDAMDRSIAQMPDVGAVEVACLEAGFTRVESERYFVQRDLRDRFLYCGKHRPELYLDADVRAGISTFRQIADADEVRLGCAQLAEDLRTGRFADVISRHHSREGDYLFVRATA